MKIFLSTTLVFLILATVGFWGYRQIEAQHQAEIEAERAAELAHLKELQNEELLRRQREAEALLIAAERSAREQAETARQLAEEKDRLLAEQAAREAAEKEAALAQARHEEAARRQADLEAELLAQKEHLAEIHRRQNVELEEKLQLALTALQAETSARNTAEVEAEERRVRLANALERQRLFEIQQLEAAVLAEEIRKVRIASPMPNDYRRRHLRIPGLQEISAPADPN
jgi:colicin import membrane protein